ncbi:MAG TPA: hypothetical protein VNX40_12090 [Mucilaginibacter sp.]|jgi:hypothetical protein|nr:hypothetical protein [Mucilaginibacter sp.]
MFPLTEQELQDDIINLLKNEEFSSRISDAELIENILYVDENPDFLPGYQLDFQLKTKYARSAKTVLASLEYLEIISGEIIKNISFQKDTKSNRERLYPDVVLANQEQSSFILIELKKDAQTEREAITELLAYAFELKNHLPNIADSDINLIIISPAFNTLLDHSVSSLLMGSKFNILALKAEYINDELSLKVHFPDSWTDIWQNTLPEYAFSSVSLVPYNYDEKKKLPDKYGIFEIVSDLIMFEGAKSNSHGFFIIWDNITAFEGTAEFCISIYQINPMVFLQASLDKEFVFNINEPLSKYILKEFNENGPYNHMESLMKTAATAKQFLDKYYDTSYEDFSSWTDHMHVASNFRSQAQPIVFNSWGNIGDYIRYFFFHPSQQKGFISEKQLSSPFYYKDPIYGIEMINRISGLTLFEDGIYNARSLYQYAKQLREYLTIADCYHRSEKEGKKYKLLGPRLFFSSLDLLCSQREIQYRINSCVDKFDDVEGLKLAFYGIKEDPVKNVLDYLNWFVKSFLNDNPLFQIFFNGAFNWCTLFSDDFSGSIEPEEKNQMEDELTGFVKSYLCSILIDEVITKSSFYGKALIEIIESVYFKGTMPKFKSKSDLIRKVNSLDDELILDSFEDAFIEILVITLSEVFHRLVPFSVSSLKLKDWHRLKGHLVKRFSEGHKYGAITIQSNGNIAIGVLPKEHQILAPITDPEKEVYVYINESGIGIVQKSTWEEVISGKPFNISNKK